MREKKTASTSKILLSLILVLVLAFSYGAKPAYSSVQFLQCGISNQTSSGAANENFTLYFSIQWPLDEAVTFTIDWGDGTRTIDGAPGAQGSYASSRSHTYDPTIAKTYSVTFSAVGTKTDGTTETCSDGPRSNTVTPVPPPPSPGTINVSTNLNNICWILNGPDGSMPSRACNTLSKQYSVMAGTYSLVADDVNCYSKNITPQASQPLASGGTISFTITYNYTCGGGGSPPGAFSLTTSYCSGYPSPSVQINFQQSANAASYDLQRKNNGSAYATVFSGTYAQMGVHSDPVSPDVTYTYQVVAYNNYGSTISSNSTNITTSSGNCGGAPPPPSCGDCSTFISWNVPTSMNAGQAYAVSVTYLNSGTNTWTANSMYRLGSQAPQDNSTWGFSRVAMPTTVTQNQQVTFNYTVVAPATPGNYQFQWRTVLDQVHWFGDYTPNLTVSVISQPSVLGFNIIYTPKVLNTPANVGVDNSVCTKMTVTWSYTDNGAGDGFTVYRSTDNSSWASVSGLLGISARSYTDIPQATNVRYYYMVRTHRAGGLSPAESGNSNSANVLDQPCLANLSRSSKTLTKINGNAYNGSSTINNGDTLTYQITIINDGPFNATINYICDKPSGNLSNIRNLTVSGIGANNGGITQSDPTCNSNFGTGIRFNVSGTKDVPDNWVLTFDATFNASAPGSQETVTNSGGIYYTDSIQRLKTVAAPSALVSTGKGQAPNFREVAP